MSITLEGTEGENFSDVGKKNPSAREKGKGLASTLQEKESKNGRTENVRDGENTKVVKSPDSLHFITGEGGEKPGCLDKESSDRDSFVGRSWWDQRGKRRSEQPMRVGCPPSIGRHLFLHREVTHKCDWLGRKKKKVPKKKGCKGTTRIKGRLQGGSFLSARFSKRSVGGASIGMPLVRDCKKTWCIK